MKRVVIFADHENLRICAQKKGIYIDYGAFKNYLADESEGRFLLEAFCYVAIDPRKPHNKDAEVRRMQRDGWLTRTKMGAPLPNGKFKCNVDVELTMDMMEFSFRAKPDIVVLVTGDQDFAAPAQKLRERGIRVEAAAFPETASYVLLNAASGFINLETYFSGFKRSGFWGKLCSRVSSYMPFGMGIFRKGKKHV